MATKQGKHMSRTPSQRTVRTNEKLKRLERKPYTLRRRKRDSKKGRSHLVVGQSESHFLGMGNSTNLLGDQPADVQSALGAIEWVTLPDHVEPGFCQLIDQTLDLYPNQDLCYSNNCSNLDLISVESESVNVESQINSSCINEFLPWPDTATSHTKQLGLPTAPRVKGRLTENIQFLEKIGASDFILKVIREGYALPFVEVPEPAEFSNNASERRYSDFVTSEISQLLSSGRIREVSRNDIHTINPLSVADKGDKLRLILDLRHINQFLRVPKIKFEDIRTIRDLFQLGDYFFKFDIESGYHHTDVLPEHQKYLGFKWEIEGEWRYFVFTVLVFGLSSAPFIFTKVVRVLIKHRRSQAIRIFRFIDDVFRGGSF